MKRLCAFILVLLCSTLTATAWTWGQSGRMVVYQGVANSELVPGNIGYGSDYTFLNLIKTASNWNVGGGVPSASQTDINGYPLSISANPFHTLLAAPSQAERPGHYVVRWIGSGSVQLSDNSGSSSYASCTGTVSGNSCVNSGCSAATGSISGNVLTVTSASSCSLVVGQPISYANTTFTAATYNATTGLVTLTLAGSIGAVPGGTITVLAAGHTYGDSGSASALNGTFAAASGTSGTTLKYTIATGLTMTLGTGYVTLGAMSQFGTPTIVTGMSGSADCPSCTGTGGTGTYLLNYSQTVGSGSVTLGGRLEVAGNSENSTGNSQWQMDIVATTTGNTVQFVEVVHISDETASWAAPEYLGASSSGLGGALFEQRIVQGNFHTIRDLGWINNVFANCTTWATRPPTSYFSYAAPNEAPSLAASSVTYNAGTDVYSVTFGSGNFTDKQTILVTWPATGTSSSKVSLNGNTAVPILNNTGQALGGGYDIPTSGIPSAIIFDATIGGALHWGFNSQDGLECGVPPEAELQLVHETGTQLWAVAQYLALDPMTDFYTQFANLAAATFPSMTPEFEVTDDSGTAERHLEATRRPRHRST